MKIKHLLLFLCLFRTVIGLAQSPEMKKDQIRQMVSQLADSIGRIYVDEAVGSRTKEALQRNLTAGKYDTQNDPQKLASDISSELIALTNDKHFGIEYSSQSSSGSGKMMMRRMPGSYNHLSIYNYYFKKMEILPGNVGLLEIDQFVPPQYTAPLIIAAMNFFANADALILDLRNCRGGDPQTVALLSGFFFKNPTLLHASYERLNNRSTELNTTKATFKGTELSTIKGVNNERAFNQDYSKLENMPLYVLTSNFTFSAGEILAYSLKALGRATIVGETSGGGGNGIRPIILNNGFRAFIPFVKAVNPITKQGWEGVGVTPDISCTTPRAQRVAHEHAIKTLMAKSSNKAEVSRLGWEQQIIDYLYNPWHPTKEQSMAYAGKYEDREIIYEGESLYTFSKGSTRILLQPIREGEFLINGATKLRFIVSSSRVNSLEITSPDQGAKTVKKL